MSGRWASSNRRSELPPDWPERRKKRFEIDRWRCTADTPYGRCGAPATECDHVGDKLDHSMSNLTSLCAPHHRAKTQRQAAEARAAALEWRKAAARRPPERHPGAL